MRIPRANVYGESYVITCPECDQPLPCPTGALKWTTVEIETHERAEPPTIKDVHGNAWRIPGAILCECGQWSRVTRLSNAKRWPS